MKVKTTIYWTEDEKNALIRARDVLADLEIYLEEAGRDVVANDEVYSERQIGMMRDDLYNLVQRLEM